MRVSKEKKKAEAISRMKKIGIFPETIRQFKKDDLVSISEPPFGAFFWAEGEDLETLRAWEEKHNALVYVVIRSYTEVGVLDSYLYVSDFEEEWDDARDDLTHNESLAYVYNKDEPLFSEHGYIGFERTIAAGLRRTA